MKPPTEILRHFSESFLRLTDFKFQFLVELISRIDAKVIQEVFAQIRIVLTNFISEKQQVSQLKRRSPQRKKLNM